MRRTLPQRRRLRNFRDRLRRARTRHTITLGFYDDGALGEVFINGGRSGEVVEAIARDGAVLLSLALQYGAELDNIKSAITRDDKAHHRRSSAR